MLPSINKFNILQKLRFASPVIENINNQLKNKINYEINNEKFLIRISIKRLNLKM